MRRVRGPLQLQSALAGAERSEVAISGAMRAEAGWRRRVSVMRILLPAAAVGLAAAVVGWPLLGGLRDTFHMELMDSDLAISNRDSVIRPRFESTDTDRRPYTVNAEKAWRPATGGNQVFLVRPEANMTAADGDRITMAAQEGVLDRDRETLRLTGGVDVNTGSGLELQTGSALLDMQAMRATTHESVRGHAPWGTLEASECAYWFEKRMIRCIGRPTLIVFPSRLEGEG